MEVLPGLQADVFHGFQGLWFVADFEDFLRGLFGEAAESHAGVAVGELAVAVAVYGVLAEGRGNKLRNEKK